MHLIADVVAAVCLVIMIAGVLIYILRRVSELGLPKGQRTSFPVIIMILVAYSLLAGMILSVLSSPFPFDKLLVTSFVFMIWILMTLGGIMANNSIYLLPKNRPHIGWLIRFGRVEFLNNVPLPMNRLRAFFGLYHFFSGFFGPHTITTPWRYGQRLLVDLVIKARPEETPEDFVSAVKTIPNDFESYLLQLMDDFDKINPDIKHIVICQRLPGFRPQLVEGRKITILLQNPQLEHRERCGPDIEIEIGSSTSS